MEYDVQMIKRLLVKIVHVPLLEFVIMEKKFVNIIKIFSKNEMPKNSKSLEFSVGVNTGASSSSVSWHNNNYKICYLFVITVFFS